MLAQIGQAIGKGGMAGYNSRLAQPPTETTLSISRKLPPALLLSLLLVSGPALAAPTLRDFFRSPGQSSFQLSPDGRTLSFLAPWHDRLNIVLRRAGQPDRRVTSLTDRDPEAYFWKGKHRLLYLKDEGGDENAHVFMVDLATGTTRDLTPYPGVRARIVDDLGDLDDAMLVGLNLRNRRVFDVYRLDLVSGALTLEAVNPGNIVSWLTDHSGHVRLAAQSDGVNTTWLYRATSRDAFVPMLTTGFRDRFVPLFFGFDDHTLFASSSLGRDRAALVEFDPQHARERRVVYAHPDVDVTRLGYSSARKTITCASFETDKPHRVCFDPVMDRVLRRLESRLPGYQVSVLNADSSENTLIVAAWNDRSRGRRYRYDVRADRLTLLSVLTPWLPEAEMAHMHAIRYPARDGLTIAGYLTLPRTYRHGRVPVIVYPHGGPWARDSWGFDPVVQFFASQGWAVLQMNYRGSTGYGKAFWEASFKQWGRAMQDDIDDGVDWLLAAGIADPGRLCIMGASYGGYAALVGITRAPERYRCAVDYAGMSNLFSYLASMPPEWTLQRETMYQMIGDPQRDAALLHDASPLFAAERIRTPLLVLQGARDPRVHLSESLQLVDVLRRRQVDVDLIVKLDEGHGFRNQENRFEAFEAMSRFFHRYLDRTPPAISSAPAAATSP
ncbi:S9 family peptidase [Paludibacterium yongneupense]|uniref:S9 family peptidase n=1 Tax=Paludibacterium yongneupense TaxID=400061 RepID=UPI00041375E3|nr:S9 family peptidase [Paludibacterium yongneupense]